MTRCPKCGWPNVGPKRREFYYWVLTAPHGETWACRKSKPKCGHEWWVPRAAATPDHPFADAFDQAKRMIEGGRK